MTETSRESFDTDLARFKRAGDLVRGLRQLREATAALEATVEANREDGVGVIKAPEGFVLQVSSYGKEVYVGDYSDEDHSHGHGWIQSQQVEAQDFDSMFVAGRIELCEGTETPIAISPDGTRYCMYPTDKIYVTLIEAEKGQ